MRALLAAAAIVASLAPGVARSDGAVTSEGVAGLTLRMTLGEIAASGLDARLGGTWSYVPRFMVDFSAGCLERDGEALLCAIVYERPGYAPSDEVQGLVVLGAALSTEEGVRVGMPLSAVEAIWGEATLSFHTADEAREYIRFENGPEGLLFRGRSPSQGEADFHVGIYSDELAEYNETTEYRADAEIGSIWLFR